MNRRKFLGNATGLGIALAFPAARSIWLIAGQVPSDLTSLSASQLSAAIKQSQVSCVEVMQAYLQRIHR